LSEKASVGAGGVEKDFSGVRAYTPSMIAARDDRIGSGAAGRRCQVGELPNAVF
jgi:hypothetical protein